MKNICINFSFGKKNAQFLPVYLPTRLPELIKNHEPQVSERSVYQLPEFSMLLASDSSYKVTRWKQLKE